MMIVCSLVIVKQIAARRVSQIDQLPLVNGNSIALGIKTF